MMEKGNVMPHNPSVTLPTSDLTLSDYQYLLQSARCLLWKATVELREDEFQWRLDPFDLAAAQRFLPLDLEPGEGYAQA